MSQPKHTPTPWRIGRKPILDRTSVVGDRLGWPDFIVANCGSSWSNRPEDDDLREQQEANAAFIVRAVNSHAEMLEALEVAERALDLRRQFEERDPSAHATLDPWTVSVAEEKARLGISTILAKARGEVQP